MVGGSVALTGFATTAFLAALGANLVAAAGWAVTGSLLARRLGRHNIIDTLWGLGFCLIAVVSVLIAAVTSSGDGVRHIVLVALVLLWGARLAWHVGRRSAGKGEDPRYAELLNKHGANRTFTAWRFIYFPQLVTLYVVSLPVQVGMFTEPPMRVIGWLGVVVWAVGIGFESVGDAQMKRFKADPATRGKLIDVGLWRYTRHPNYFGDACVWIGIFLVAAEHWPGMLTVISPVLMTYLLAFGTGKRLLEKSMSKRPGYDEYIHRTSGFVPLPPRSPRA
ncbi:MAG: DUF1295 domain-containing protein [Nocardioidaceae bacterium]